MDNTLTGTAYFDPRQDDPHGKFLEGYMEHSIYNKPMIDAYDHWLKNLLPMFLADRKISDTYRLKITNFQYQSPMSTNTYKLYPYTAIKDDLTYLITVVGDWELHNVKTGKIELDGKNQVLFVMPLMVGSEFCNISSFTREEELIRFGETPSKPRGYFILKGSNRTVIIQEKQISNELLIYTESSKRLNKLNCYSSKPVVTVGRLTYETPTSASQIFVIRDCEKDTGLVFESSYFGETSNKKKLCIPIYLLFYHKELLGPSTTEIEITELILSFVNPNNRIIFKGFLTKSIFAFKELLKTIQTQGSETPLEAYLIKFTKNLELDRIVSKFDESMINDFFPYLNGTGMKASNAAYYVSRYVSVMINLTEPDNRDSWANKRLDWAPRTIQQKVMSYFNEKINDSVLKIQETGGVATSSNFTNIIFSNNKEGELTKCFSRPFWNAHSNKNITETTEEKSIINLYSQYTKINSSVSEQTKEISLREVKGDQLGFICPSETTEGGKCGLTKHLTCVAQISLERDFNVVYDIIRRSGFVSKSINNDCKTMITLNGQLIGFCNGIKTREHLINLKRKKILFKDISVVLENYNFMEKTVADYSTLKVHCDGGRPIRPLIIYKDDITYRDKTYRELEDSGYIEYLDPSESYYILLAESIQQVETVIKNVEILENKLKITDPTDSDYQNIIRSLSIAKKRTKFTHLELDPSTMFGYAASMVPMPERIPGPRISNQSGYGKQAISIGVDIHSSTKFKTSYKVLNFANKPLFVNNLTKQINNLMPNGRMVLVAIMPFGGFNMEDAMILNKATNDRGYFSYSSFVSKTILTTNKELIKHPENLSRNLMQKFKFADKNGPTDKLDSPIFRHLSSLGIVRRGSILEKGDVIVFKYYSEKGNEKVTMIKAGVDEIGKVDNVRVLQIGNTYKIEIKIENYNKGISVGDKLVIRYSQKGVVGKIVEEEKMPYIKSTGQRVDVIINPHSLPSRMTISMLIEMLLSKYSCITGNTVNSTAFRENDISLFKEKLKQFGIDENGYEELIDPATGEPYPQKIQCGPLYIHSLPHISKDKIQGVGRAPVDDNKQPLGGRNRGGGIRVGEMESWSFISHGAINILLDRLMFSSDKFSEAVCSCGKHADYNKDTGTFSCKNKVCTGEVGRIDIPFSFRRFLDLTESAGHHAKLEFIRKEDIKGVQEGKDETIIFDDMEEEEEEEIEDYDEDYEL